MKNPWSGIGWIFALGIAVFAFTFSPSQYRYYEDCAKVDYGKAIPSSIAVGIEKAVESGGDKRPETQNEQETFAITCSDLAAQWAVADYTHKAFWMGLIGVGFIFMTLRYTRDAARSASETLVQSEQATQAAWESVEVARDIGRKQVRAYVTVKDVWFWFEPKTSMFCAIVDVDNTGNSPAQNIFTSARARMWTTNNDGKRESVHMIAPPFPGADIPVGEFQIMIEFSRTPTIADLASTFDVGTFAIEFCGEDVFGSPWRAFVKGLAQNKCGNWTRNNPCYLFRAESLDPSYNKANHNRRVKDPKNPDPANANPDQVYKDDY